jgi:glycosyltransferase involved in cell wall biosynthesis
MSLHRADKIIAVSEFTKNEIIKFYKIAPEKIAVAYNAVGDNFSENISEEKLEEVRKKYTLPEKFILYLGTMQPRKNLSALIEAFAKIKKEFPPLEKGDKGGFENLNSSYKSLSDSPFSKGRELVLVLAGGKGHNYDKKIDETIKENSLENEVIFPGFIDEEDKPAVYKLAEIFCFPSLYEGFGIPVLEAMVSGVPAIVSDIAPHREIAQDSVLYFNPESPDDLAEKLVQLLENEELKNDLILKEREQAQKFSWKKSAQKILEIFKNIPIDNPAKKI